MLSVFTATVNSVQVQPLTLLSTIQEDGLWSTVKSIAISDSNSCLIRMPKVQLMPCNGPTVQQQFWLVLPHFTRKSVFIIVTALIYPFENDVIGVFGYTWFFYMIMYRAIFSQDKRQIWSHHCGIVAGVVSGFKSLTNHWQHEYNVQTRTIVPYPGTSHYSKRSGTILLAS